MMKSMIVSLAALALIGNDVSALSSNNGIAPKQSLASATTRRTAIASIGFGLVSIAQPVQAADGQKNFAPGGTLVDYEVGVNVGNAQASMSRKPDNSNVLFNQDYYYKFGTAPTWVVDDSFPKTMPFTVSQQRYDALKKYKDRVLRGVAKVQDLKDPSADVLSHDAPEYSIRPMGLLANNFLASENTGTTNELLLARWYINEIYLDIEDVRTAKTAQERKDSYAALVNAMNSYLYMMNRVITPKVGDKFVLIEL